MRVRKRTVSKRLISKKEKTPFETSELVINKSDTLSTNFSSRSFSRANLVILFG